MPDYAEIRNYQKGKAATNKQAQILRIKNEIHELYGVINIINNIKLLDKYYQITSKLTSGQVKEYNYLCERWKICWK